MESGAKAASRIFDPVLCVLCGASELKTTASKSPFLGALLLRRRRRLVVPEECEAGGMAVDEVGATDGAELAGSEETGDGCGGEQLAGDADVVAGLLEHAGAAAVATEQQGARRWIGRRHRLIEQQSEVFVCGSGVADVVLDGLADADLAVDGDRAGLVVNAHEIPHEEIAAAEGVAVFADRLAEEQAVAEQLLLLRWHGVDDLAQDGEGRL